jgi:uncharacterized cofD-like protein
MAKLREYSKWFTPGIGVKRWLLLLLIGTALIAVGLSLGILKTVVGQAQVAAFTQAGWVAVGVTLAVGLALVVLSVLRLGRNLVQPYRRHQQGAVVDVVFAHSRRQKGIRLVAIGGGTGLPSVLRGLKAITSNITAVVTVADDGGSSGRLRRDLKILPPGDLRNNIAALADDESLMTQLFQYRFSKGDLSGHAFGNLFISALAGVTGSLEAALIETERVLNIQGRVLPATLDDVTLCATVRLSGASDTVKLCGESRITAAGGRIQRIEIDPPTAVAYSESVQSILDADLVILGPGSLYTSILPNLVVPGIAEALRSTSAYKLYVCNVATQPGETTGYSVADHVLALEEHIGRGIFQAVLANNRTPPLDEVSRHTRFVQPAPDGHPVLQRYDVRYVDLVDEARPWRHDPGKLAAAILATAEGNKRQTGTRPAVAEISEQPGEYR